jgi:hypothetical protein
VRESVAFATAKEWLTELKEFVRATCSDAVEARFVPRGSGEKRELVAAVQPMIGGIAPTIDPISVFQGVSFFLHEAHYVGNTKGTEILAIHWRVDTGIEQEVATRQRERERISAETQ